MNIITENKKIIENKKLFENNQQINTNQEIVITNNTVIESIFDVKSKQFHFENGSFMGSISVDTGNAFGLKYHKNTTNNFNEFIESINNFLKASEFELTELDINNLKIEYLKG